MEPLLQIEDLEVRFDTHHGVVDAVRGVSFKIYKGETVAIVGESGCGKSVTALAITRLIPSPGRIVKGRIFFQGKDLALATEKELRQVRGQGIGMIFQDPLASLNPTMKVGEQIMEILRCHQKLSRGEAKERAIELMRLAGLAFPEKRFSQYPHELSGGMRQRIMIAIALACHPVLLIADEPTTALDVTIQAQILDLMRDLQKQMGMSILLITHDLGVVAGMCDRMLVMYEGKIVEEGSVDQLFYHPQHPYTNALLKSICF